LPVVGTTAPPLLPEVDWSLLTPRSREIVSQIGLRLVAGYSLEEIAAMIEAERPEVKNLPMPAGKVTKQWVAQRWKELRHECQQQWSASTSSAATTAR
jgi:hypothetical protein